MLGFGIIGTNFISEWFVAACGLSNAATAVAVYSRDAGRGREFAAANGLPRAYTDFDQLLDDPEVAAVYIASPIAAHHWQAMRALAAGKHVLVEKTIGANAAQAAEIFATAHATGLVAAEAIRPLFDPNFLLIAQHLGELGPIRQARFAKLQYSSRYDRVKAGELLNAFDPKLGNSAVADIGVYCLEPALYLFGNPTSAQGAAVRLANGFEGAGTLLLSYPDKIVDCTWSKITSSSLPNTIHGEQATMVIDSISQPSRIEIDWRGGGLDVLLDQAPQADADNMCHEVNAFVSRIDSGDDDPIREQAAITARRLMDDYLATA